MSIKQIHRNSFACEPVVRKAPNGDLLVVTMAEGLYEPSLDNKLFLLRSTDGENFKVIGNMLPEEKRAVTTPELYVIDDKIYVFACMHTGKQLCWETVMLVSEDNGYTWQNKGRPSFVPNYMCLRNMIQNEDGEYIFAYQYFPIDEKEEARLVSLDANVFHADIDYIETGILKTRDMVNFERFVVNRQMIDKSIPKEKYERWNWPEPTITELEKDHLVVLTRRNNTGYIYRNESFDGGKTWTETVKTDIPNPANKFKVYKLSDGRIILLNTPNNAKTNQYESRNPFEIWLSNDNMKSWYKKIRLTDFPGLFAYPDGFENVETNEFIFTFEFNRKDVYLVKVDLKNDKI